MNENEEPKPFNEDDFTHYLVETIKNAIADRKQFDNLIDSWYNDWRDIKGVKLFPWKGCANWSVPITSVSADDVTPRVIENIFDINPPIDVQAQNTTATEYRDIIKQFLNWDLDAHPELYEQLWYFVQNTVWSGTGFIKSFFAKEKTKIEARTFDAYIVNGEPAKDPNTGVVLQVNQHNTELLTQSNVPFEVKEITEKKRRWKKYNPDITTLDIKDVIFPSDSESIQDAWDNSLIAVRVWRTKDYLMRQLQQDEKELYKNLNKVKIRGLEAKQATAKDDREREQIAKFAAKTKKIECFEIYVNYDVDGDSVDEKLVALLGWEDELLFGYEEYDYEHGRCPITPGHIKPIHKQPFGVGIPEMLFDTKGEIDSVHNQRTDRGALHNDPILTHTEKSGFNRKTHKTGPGRQWRLIDRSESAIGYLQNPAKSENVSFQEENLLMAYAQKRTKVIEPTTTEGAISKNKTAAGVMALIKEGNRGFRTFTRWMSLSIAEIFRQRFALYQQYWGKASDPEVKQWIKEILDIPGNPLTEQSLEAVKQQFNIVMTATKEDTQMELTKAQAAHEILIENPLMQQFPLKMREIVIDLLRATGVKEPEGKVPTGEEIKQWQVGVQKETLRQMEQEKAQANIQEAGKAGYDKEMARLGAANEQT